MFQSIFLFKFVRASGEAILSTQRYFSKRFLVNNCRASGEAILGTQRYFLKPYSQRSLDQGFQKNLAASEHDERNRLEFKTRNPGKRRFKEKEKKNKIVPKNALFAIRILSRNQF